MKRLYLSLVIFGTSLISNAQTWQDTLSSIETHFSRYQPSNPGAQFAISRGGKLIFSKSWGMADLEHSVPITNESISEAGSVSKQFTAASILLLEQQGMLSLDDDVKKYVPELPDYGHTITLRQMIQHTSGLRDWGSIAEMAGWPRWTKAYSNEDALDIICNQKTLNHKPGDEYIYSNSNYQLLTIIVQRVSGMSLAEFTRKHIFEPAGMNHTQWRDDYTRVVLNRAIGYSKSDTEYKTFMPNEFAYGNGGLLTTTEDLLIWINYMLDGKFGSPSLLEKQLERNTFNNGVMHNYGAGLFVGTYRGWKYFSHSGETAGYRAYVEAYPELDLAFAFLSNTSEFDLFSMNLPAIVADMFVPIKVPETKPKTPKPYVLEKDKLNTYASWYKNLKTGEGLKLYLMDETLHVTDDGELMPVSESEFLTMNGNKRFTLKQNGLNVITDDADSVNYLKIDAAELDDRSMNEYEGEYFSDEVGVKYQVVGKDKKLFLILKPKYEFLLEPTYKDGFKYSEGIVYFERKNSEIINFKISSYRARNVEFNKIK